MSLSAREKASLTRWRDGDRPFYEVYYLTASDPAQSLGLWLRYVILAAEKRPPEASVWAMLFDGKDPSKNAALRRTYSLKDVRIERDFFYFGAGESAVFDDGCRGDLNDGHQRASWELKFEGNGDPLLCYPRFFYRTGFPKTKYMIPRLTTKLSGEFSWDDRRWNFSSLTGHLGHLWGVEHGESWIWANAAIFDEDPSFCFDGLSARVRFGEKVSRPFTLLFFRWEGRLYKCNSVRQWLTNRSEGELDRWHFEAVSGELMFVGDIHASPERMMAVRYQDPTGGERFSHHTEQANVRIQILRKSNGGWQTIKMLHARQSAAYEVVRRDHDPRVRLLLP